MAPKSVNPPQRARHSAKLHFVKLAFHDTDTDMGTDILARILARKSRVSDVRMYRRVGRVGVESVSVSVSAPWNASLTDDVRVVNESGRYGVCVCVCVCV